MVCLVWLRDEALNVLKRWSPEQLSDEKNDEEDEQYQTTRHLVYIFFFTVWVKINVVLVKMCPFI